MAKYKKVNRIDRLGKSTSVLSCIKDTESDPIKFIPTDPANTDYAEYLKWVAAGNTADAAD
tara:strand:+ start:361 stop:543 length:183 start_codon:yes stop_codon:yes gene_type:complete